MSVIRVYTCPPKTKDNPYPIEHKDYECASVEFDIMHLTAKIIGGEHDGEIIERCCGVRELKRRRL